MKPQRSKINPFKYGREVSGYQFYDRSEDCDRLCRCLKSGGCNVVMYAPRRYGKTSLVSKVLERLKEEDGIKSLLFDLTMVTNLGRFCEEYVNAVYAMVGGRKELVHQLMSHLANLNPSVSVNVAGVLTVKLELKHALTESAIGDVLDLPERLSEDIGGVPLVVAFDEFQEVAELSKEYPLEKIFRSRIQKQRNVRYVFLGSKTHLLERMFLDHSRPFYRSAREMPLSKPPEAESREFVRSRFFEAGLFIADTEIDLILQYSDNIPYYLQAVSFFTFDYAVADGRSEITSGDVESAVADLVAAGSGYYAAQVAGFSDSQRSVVSALAEKPTAVFDTEYREQFDLPTSSTLHSAVKELVNDGVLEIVDGVYYVGDPMFVRYLRTSPVKIFG